jgi:hypothetical protein
VPPERAYGTPDALFLAEVGVPLTGLNRDVITAQERAEKPQRILDQGGDRRSEQFQGADSTLKRGSTNADYLTARIARDHPAILARMRAGEFQSNNVILNRPEERAEKPQLLRESRRPTNEERVNNPYHVRDKSDYGTNADYLTARGAATIATVVENEPIPVSSTRIEANLSAKAEIGTIPSPHAREAATVYLATVARYMFPRLLRAREAAT